MAGNLGKFTVTGALLTGNPVTAGAWACRFRTQDTPHEDFEVYHGFVRGPGGYFLVYLDDAGYGAGQNGRINEYGPSIPMYVRDGQEIWLYWSIATGSAPTATLYFRKPEAGKL